MTSFFQKRVASRFAHSLCLGLKTMSKGKVIRIFYPIIKVLLVVLLGMWELVTPRLVFPLSGSSVKVFLPEYINKAYFLKLQSSSLRQQASNQTRNKGRHQMGHFYNVDREVTIKGKILEIKIEPRYQEQVKFLILMIEEDRTGKKFQVEVSPTWFFERDFHQGEHVELKGSLVKENEEKAYVIAREMRCGGEFFILRDKHGFPTWRGRAHHHMGRRKKGR